MRGYCCFSLYCKLFFRLNFTLIIFDGHAFSYRITHIARRFKAYNVFNQFDVAMFYGSILKFNIAKVRVAICLVS